MSKAATLLMVVFIPFLQGCKDTYSRGDCDPGYLDVKGKCTLAVGQPCESSGDCLADICIQGQDSTSFCSISCHVHDDCPSGFFCTFWDDSRCYPGQRPPPCSSDEECGPCQECDKGLCLQVDGCVLCNDDDGCGPCQRCDAGQCISVAGCTMCLGDYQCATCEVCSESKKCTRVAGCTLCNDQQDCPGCTTCERGACIPIEGCGQEPCFNDLDCPQKTKCLLDPALGMNVCMPSDQAMGADCTRGGAPQCRSGICLLADDGSGWCSVSCDEEHQCPLGYDCAPDDQCTWACRIPSTPPPGKLCTWEGDCNGGQSNSEQACVPVWNQSNDNWEYRCVENLACSEPAGSSCEIDSQRCYSGICSSEGFCTSVCNADYQCPDSFVCTEHHQTIQPELPKASFGACVPIQLAKFGIGQPCPGGDQDCVSGMCLLGNQYGPISVCSQTCIPGETDCPDGFVCSFVGGGLFACTAALPGGGCTADSECQDGEVCKLDVSGIPYCGEPNTDGEIQGQPCNFSAQCKSGICLPEGVCSSLCNSAQDCRQGAWCYVRAWFRTDGRSVAESLCSPSPGSLLPCKKDSDCSGDEICRPGLNEFGTGIGGRCSPAGTGFSFWQSCDNSRQCASGVCVSLGACSSLCEQDGDCPQGFTCEIQEVEFLRNIYETRACRPAPVGLGQPCPWGDDDCESHICYVPPEGDAYCTVSCSSTDDCQQVPEMTCVSDPDGTTCRLP